MDRFHYEILSNLKERYLLSHGEATFQVSETGPDASARQFYVDRLEDNLVQPMSERHRCEYACGSGSELDDKMKALRSSSAMTFNIFRNGPCAAASPDPLFSSDRYEVAYEYQLPTLKQGMPANLDALLTGSAGDVIACEMKLMEWLGSAPAPLKDKYLDTGAYLFLDTADEFVKTAMEMKTEDVFARYDAAQMFKHALALYNACRSGVLSTDTITLLNCVWEPPDDYDLSDKVRTKLNAAKNEERLGFKRFQHAMQPIMRLFAESTDTHFIIVYLPAAEVIGKLRYASQERQLMRRYL